MTCLARAEGTCFCLDDGKEGSALYNLMGIDWMFRGEGVNGMLTKQA